MTSLLVRFKNGELWSIPITTIALHAAERYGHGEIDYSVFDHFKKQHGEAVDWFRNEMHWSDVEQTAQRIDATPPYDYESNLADADIMVEEKS